MPDLAALERSVGDAREGVVHVFEEYGGKPPEHYVAAALDTLVADVVALERARARVFPADAVLPEVTGDE